MIFCLSVTVAAEPGDNTSESGAPTLTARRTLTDYPFLNKNFFGTHFFSGAFTTGMGYGSFIGLQGTFDYQIDEFFSAGLQGNLYFGNSQFKWDRTPSLGLRGSYHFLERGHIDSAPMDLYAGLGLGADMGKNDKEAREVGAYVAVHVGFRYKVAYNWLVFSELSTRNAALGMCFMF